MKPLETQTELWKYIGDITNTIYELKKEIEDLRNIIYRLSPHDYREHLINKGLNNEEINFVIAKRFGKTL